MVGVHKLDWHCVLYDSLCASQILVRIAIRFTPFQLVYGLEAILLIECYILSLKRAI